MCFKIQAIKGDALVAAILSAEANELLAEILTEQELVGLIETESGAFDFGPFDEPEQKSKQFGFGGRWLRNV